MIKGIEKISTVNMPHDEWLRLRQGHIGGSDASAIVGMNAYSSPYTVWADKLGKIPPKADNEAMRQGRDLEEYVAKRFTEATGKKVRRENAILINPQYPFAHANVDRMVVGEDAGLECKTTSIMNLGKFKNGEFPSNYYAQCVHYMMVTGCKRWYLSVLVLSQGFYWFCIERDEEEINALKEAEIKFWKCVQSKTEPAIDGTKSTSDTLSQVYSNSIEVTADLSLVSSEINLRAKYDEQIKELTALRDECDNKIKSFMRDSDKGVYGEHTITWSNQTRNTFDSKKFMADNPQFDYSKYQKQTVSRVYRFK